MDFDGLKKDIIKLLANEEVKVDTESFQNDMTKINSRDDVLTVLIHLGYLTYDKKKSTVKIPNKEVTDAFIQSIKNFKYEQTYESIRNANDLLEAIWREDEEAVAQGLEKVRDSFINTNLKYNDENSLYTTLFLLLYGA